MKTAEFDFVIPEELIAQEPLEKRDEARLLTYLQGNIAHKKFYHIVELLREDDVIVLNDSRVISCRLIGHKEGTDGRMEVFLLKRIDPLHWEALLKPLRKAKSDQRIKLSDDLFATLEKDHYRGDVNLIKMNRELTYEELEQIAITPLPPYIKRDIKSYPDAQRLKDSQFYQTVYACEYGSVASPTAGLHFTTELLEKIKTKGVRVATVTLEVSMGTFKPVESDNIEDHLMHSEHYRITAASADIINSRKGRLVSIGTTSLRVLESVAARYGKIVPCEGDTDIFIYPGFPFKVCDVLVTNFHLPRSTLLMLVSAFIGKEEAKRMYACAAAERYRFYSFGDATFLERNK